MKKRFLLCLVYFGVQIAPIWAQDNSGSRQPLQISGSAAVTNNGISLVPSFSLEQAAAILNLTLQKGNFSFEPELAFSLEEGRPWYQIYWLRYRILNEGKFKLRSGAHLGLNFARIQDDQGEDAIEAERYLTAELAPSYEFSEKLSLGIYYLTSRGFDIDNNTPLHFLTLNAEFTGLRVSPTLYMEIIPQVYYLNSFGDGEGYYLTSVFKLSKINFPLTLSTNMNKALSTNIDGKDFLWNLTLTYQFGEAIIDIP